MPALVATSPELELLLDDAAEVDAADAAADVAELELTEVEEAVVLVAGADVAATSGWLISSAVMAVDASIGASDETELTFSFACPLGFFFALSVVIVVSGVVLVFDSDWGNVVKSPPAQSAEVSVV